MQNLKLKEDLKQINFRLFLSQHSEKFQQFLSKLDSTSKDIIRKNNQLNQMYDLFLDFIIDSNQFLDYIDSKEVEMEAKK